MRSAILAFVLAVQALPCHAQDVILPGDPSIDTRLVKPGRSSMTYAMDIKGKWTQIGTFETELALAGAQLRANTRMRFHGKPDQWIGSQVVDAATFKPVHSAWDRERGKLELSFGPSVSGEYLDKKTGKETSVDLPLSGPYFDYATVGYLLRALPLRTGYRAVIPVYAYEAKDNSRTSNVVVKEVKSGIYVSRLTGEHPVWQVVVHEEGFGNRLHYRIDKDTRRIWQVDIEADGASGTTLMRLVDEEIDFQPYENTFDRDATLAMVNDGNSVIKGKASARIMISVNGKRTAQKGTRVMLIPDTPFFKEWVAVNEERKKGGTLEPLPLLEGMRDTFKVAEVYDDEGSFEFTNLKPGDYILTTSFQYQYGYSATVETGRSGVYYKNTYQGDYIHYDRVRRTATEQAAPEARVTIQADGDTVEVNLIDRIWR